MDQSIISLPQVTAQPEEGLRDAFLSSKAVRARYGGISAQWLWRHEKDETFPAAVRINKRKYWRLKDLLEYERSLT
jgi:predicted DNA-binding transcriptional regulator AlpA